MLICRLAQMGLYKDTQTLPLQTQKPKEIYLQVKKNIRFWLQGTIVEPASRYR